MSVFELSNEVDSNKVFLVNLTELNKRYDPYYHKYDFKSFREKLDNENFIDLGKIITDWNRGDGPREGFYTNDSTNGVYFLRVNNLKEHSINLTDVKYINRHIHEGKLKRTQVTSGDLIFAISGTKDNLGTVSIVPKHIKEANLNSAIVRLDIDTSKVDKKFFCFMFDLKFVRFQIDYIGKGAAQNNLNNQEICEIKIPNFSIEKQLEIVNYLEKAKLEKQTKHQTAQNLLNSIDDYLLTELDITLPEVENSLDNRMFTTMFSEVSGGRFDPFYLLNCIDVPTSDIYDEFSLKELATVKKGQSITSSKIIKGDYPVIAGGQTSPYSHNIFNEKGNIITVSASGAYSGYVWYHTQPIFASDCSVIKSKDENRVTTLFLSEVLKMKQQEIYNLQQGSGQPHVYPSDLERIKIPLPPLEKQTAIANHISDLRQQAKQLQTEAEAAMTAAKAEVERMILGE